MARSISEKASPTGSGSTPSLRNGRSARDHRVHHLVDRGGDRQRGGEQDQGDQVADDLDGARPPVLPDRSSPQQDGHQQQSPHRPQGDVQARARTTPAARPPRRPPPPPTPGRGRRTTTTLAAASRPSSLAPAGRRCSHVSPGRWSPRRSPLTPSPGSARRRRRRRRRARPGRAAPAARGRSADASSRSWVTSTSCWGSPSSSVADATAVAEVEQGRRLVGDQDRRPGREHPGQGEQLALAAGQPVHAAVAEAREPVPARTASAARSRSRLVAVRTPQRQGDVLARGRHHELRGRVGEHEADPAAYLPPSRPRRGRRRRPGRWWRGPAR